MSEYYKPADLVEHMLYELKTSLEYEERGLKKAEDKVDLQLKRINDLKDMIKDYERVLGELNE